MVTGPSYPPPTTDPPENPISTWLHELSDSPRKSIYLGHTVIAALLEWFLRHYWSFWHWWMFNGAPCNVHAFCRYPVQQSKCITRSAWFYEYDKSPLDPLNSRPKTLSTLTLSSEIPPPHPRFLLNTCTVSDQWLTGLVYKVYKWLQR